MSEEPLDGKVELVTASPLQGQLFRWTVDKSTRSFRVFVVEPSLFVPDQHAKIFNAVLTSLLRPEALPEDLYRQQRNISIPEPFDLVTFPEAFLSTDDLVRTLTQIAEYGSMGCIHVGLRSSKDSNSHLIGTEEFRSIIAQLSGLSTIVGSDFAQLNTWLDQQRADDHSNIGCLFLLDAEGKLRICLHPKMVRSGFEVGVVADERMTEANLLSLVTLLPDSRKFLTVTIQPIICSDTLQLAVDDPGRRPLDCLNGDYADVFPDTLPDHIDVVSVTACTPQSVGHDKNGITFRKWHEEFRATFERVIKGGAWHRHYHATFILSNFQEMAAVHDPMSRKTLGGLSGGFIPLPAPPEKPEAFAEISMYGKGAQRVDNRWTDPMSPPESDFRSLGYIAQLTPQPSADVAARMMGFVITTFPRDAPHFEPGSSLAKFQLRIGRFKDDGTMTFAKGET